MSKSILVIDTPDVCVDCPCHFSEESGIVWCGKEEKELLSDDIESYKPDWCPLKEVPEKKIHDSAKPVEKQWGYEFTNGYNYCIDQILKEVFENPMPYSGDNIGSKD